jgi:hypothetical protein
MHNTLAKEVITRLTKVESQLEQHLIEGGYVKSDIAWLKKSMWVCVSASLSGTISIIVYAITKALQG